jgi:hypothetical protein
VHILHKDEVGRFDFSQDGLEVLVMWVFVGWNQEVWCRLHTPANTTAATHKRKQVRNKHRWE